MAKKTAVLVVDFGMSKIHACLINISDGSLILECEATYQWDKMANKRAEIHSEKLFVASKKAVHDLLLTYQPDCVDICALGFSYFGDNFVCLDDNMIPLTPLISPTDLRGEEEAEELKRVIGDETFSEHVGSSIHADLVAPKLLWIKNHHPEILSKTKLVGTLQQYVILRLGLPPFNDPSMASTKTLLHTRTGVWVEDLSMFCGVTTDMLGEIVPSSSVIGKISSYDGIALPHDIPVIIGGHDSMCGNIGLGLHPHGTVNSIGHLAGTYNLMQIETSQFINTYHEFKGTLSGWTECGPYIGSFHLQCGDNFGPSINWFVSEFYSKKPGALAKLSSMAKYDCSCTVQQRHDPLFGNAVFSNISTTNTVVDLFTALMENNTFRLRVLLDAITKVNRKPFDSVRIGAGGAIANNLNQFKADLFGLRVEQVKNLQASSVGVAAISAVGIGHYSNYTQALSSMVSINKVYEPDLQISGKYQEKYGAYLFDRAY